MEPESSGASRLEDSVEFAYRSLRADILSGAVPPGTVLSQVKLAARFDISRTPLREALRRLVAENLVVADFNQRMRVSELNLDDFDQIYAIRVALEPVAIAATLAQSTQAYRESISAHVDAMDVAIQDLDIDRFRAEHRAFHLGLTAGSGQRIARLLEEMWDNTERYRIRYLHHDYADPTSESNEQLRAAQVEHRLISEAALAGDAIACGAASVEHLHQSLEIVYREAATPPRVRIADQALRLSSAAGATP